LPHSGPGDQEADVIGSRQMPAHKRRVLERDAVERQPDALQPDDEDELESAPRQRREEPGELPAVNIRIRNSSSRNIGSGTRPSTITNTTSRSAADQLGDHRRVAPAHARVPYGWIA
jgi:hypothetical protein